MNSDNLLGWVPTFTRLSSLIWSSKVAFASGGLPEIVLYFNGGIGDDLMRSAVARELRKRGAGKIWQMTSVVDLYAGNTDFVAVPDDYRLYRLCRMFSIPCVQLNYPEQPQRHFITEMCELAGITGEIELRPYVVLRDDERRAGKVVQRRQIVMQTSSLASRYPMRNKLWFDDRFQSVADALKRDFDIVQLGATGDPKLDGVLDLRGKTSIREAAVILGASHTFIGLATGLVHLARAVDCRSVVIYGGREDPRCSGYSANENLDWHGSCAPCWLRNDCDYDRVCMNEILPEHVIGAVERQAERYGTPLAVDRYHLAARGTPNRTCAGPEGPV